jgi:hypothetical protein
MRHKTTEAVFSYFNTLRADRDAPLRTEIDPSVLKAELPDLFIMEKGRDGNVTFRLAGTRVCIILGQELRGRGFAEIWDDDVRHKMRLAADAVIANRSALEVAVTGTDEAGQTMALEMLLLPLFSRVDVCDRIFGSLVSLEAVPTLDALPRILKPAQFSFTAIDDGKPSIPRGQTTAARARAVGTIGSLVNRVTHLRVFEGGRRD